MTTENDKAQVLRIAGEVWNQGHLDTIDDLMVPDGRYHGPHMPRGTGGREDWRRAVAMYRGAFPDSHVTYEELLASGSTIIGRWSATGTHTGELPGLAPTGKPISITGITIYRMADGRIVEAWEQLDLLGMWRQLGVFRGPGHE